MEKGKFNDYLTWQKEVERVDHTESLGGFGRCCDLSE